MNQATLTVNKVKIGGSNGDKFNLQIDGSTVGTGNNVGNGGTTGPVTVSAGILHQVGEAASASTTLSDYIQTFSSDCAADGTITLTADTSKICIITNTHKPQLTVTKYLCRWATRAASTCRLTAARRGRGPMSATAAQRASSS